MTQTAVPTCVFCVRQKVIYPCQTYGFCYRDGGWIPLCKKVKCIMRRAYLDPMNWSHSDMAHWYYRSESESSFREDPDALSSPEDVAHRAQTRDVAMRDQSDDNGPPPMVDGSSSREGNDTPETPGDKFVDEVAWEMARPVVPAPLRMARPPSLSSMHDTIVDSCSDDSDLSPAIPLPHGSVHAAEQPSNNGFKNDIGNVHEEEKKEDKNKEEEEEDTWMQLLEMGGDFFPSSSAVDHDCSNTLRSDHVL